MTVPSTRDWSWLGRQSLQDLAAYGTDPDEMIWIRRFWSWLYSRLSEDRLQGLPAPISQDKESGLNDCWIPVLAVDLGSEGSQLTFLNIDSGIHDSSQELDSMGIPEAYSNGWDCVEGDFVRTAGSPRPSFIENPNFSGTSAGGSAFVLGVTQALKVSWPNDHAITACWDSANERGSFKPVQSELIEAKIQLAVDWGYRHLWVCEGQKGLPEDGIPIEFHYLPQKPQAALSCLLPYLSLINENALLRALVAYDRAFINGLSKDQDSSTVMKLTEPFIQKQQSDLVRKIAHDLRSRSLLHAGETLKSIKEKTTGDSIQVDRLPDNQWVGHYLRREQPLHHAVLALDLGKWEDSVKEHETLDRVIGELSKGEPLLEHELVTRIKARNVRARRWDFLGRYHQDQNLLKKSIGEYLAEADHWDFFVEYENQMGIEGATLRRQHNQLLDPILATFDLTRHIPIELLGDWKPWIDRLKPNEFGSLTDDFDRAYAIRWWFALGEQVNDAILAPLKDEFLQILDNEKSINYPQTLLPEALLRTNSGTKDIQDLAALVLMKSELVNNPVGDLVKLLGCRAIELCRKQTTAELSFPNFDQNEWADRARSLLADPESLIFRCPY